MSEHTTNLPSDDSLEITSQPITDTEKQMQELLNQYGLIDGEFLVPGFNGVPESGWHITSIADEKDILGVAQPYVRMYRDDPRNLPDREVIKKRLKLEKLLSCQPNLE